MTEPPTGQCPGCGAALDNALFASCAVCLGLHLCLACAPQHLCTDQCLARGCHPGLCMRVVRDGVTAEAFGVPDDLPQVQ